MHILNGFPVVKAVLRRHKSTTAVEGGDVETPPLLVILSYSSFPFPMLYAPDTHMGKHSTTMKSFHFMPQRKEMYTRVHLKSHCATLVTLTTGNSKTKHSRVLGVFTKTDIIYFCQKQYILKKPLTSSDSFVAELY